ncbi:MAG: class I SAM-dependent methyltransferase [Cytophagaceae bacterium]
MEELKECPSCMSNDLSVVMKTKDYSVTQENFTIARCNNCGLWFTNPRPSENAIGRYYQSQDYISHTNTSKGIINRLYHQVRNITLKKKVALINSLHKGKGSILDMGCGTGYFLAACKNDGWKVEGMEPDDNARKMASEITNTRINKSLDVVPNGPYDIITLWHVLEHIHKLNETLETLYSKLSAKGKLIIAVPNCSSYDAAKYDEKWAAYDVPRHLYHFTPETIKPLLKKHHFNIIDVKPMVFDSFYVSMISEKYKGSGIIGLLKAFQTGLISNMKAGKNKSSSQIYIIEKA